MEYNEFAINFGKTLVADLTQWSEEEAKRLAYIEGYSFVKIGDKTYKVISSEQFILL